MQVIHRSGRPGRGGRGVRAAITTAVAALIVACGSAGNSSPTAKAPATASSASTTRPSPSSVVATAEPSAGAAATDPQGCLAQADSLCPVAGTGSAGAGTAGPATQSQLNSPIALAIDGSGNLFIADANGFVDGVTPSGLLSVIAGTGNASQGPLSPGSALSTDLDPVGLAVDPSGDLYISDGDTQQVVKISPDGALSIVAGDGTQDRPVPGPATSSPLQQPEGLVLDPAGDLYIADEGISAVEKVTPSGILSLVAGDGRIGPPTPGPATSSELNNPTALAMDSAGDLYVADPLSAVVVKITPSETLSIIAGTEREGTPVPGPAVDSPLGYPCSLALDSAGDLYIADSQNAVVERVTPSGMLSVVAGTGSPGTPLPGPATRSGLNMVQFAVAVDGAGDLYIADTDNNVVERVTRP